MTLTKGNIIKKIRTNPNPLCGSANDELTYRVDKVNKNTYSLTCIDGYMKNTSCKLIKDFKEESVDVYGTITRWIVIE